MASMAAALQADVDVALLDGVACAVALAEARAELRLASPGRRRFGNRRARGLAARASPDATRAAHSRAHDAIDDRGGALIAWPRTARSDRARGRAPLRVISPSACVERLNPALNAIVQFDRDAVIAKAERVDLRIAAGATRYPLDARHRGCKAFVSGPWARL